MSNIWGGMSMNTINFIILLIAAMGVWLGYLIHAEVEHRRRKHKHREKES